MVGEIGTAAGRLADEFCRIEVHGGLTQRDGFLFFPPPPKCGGKPVRDEKPVREAKVRGDPDAANDSLTTGYNR